MRAILDSSTAAELVSLISVESVDGISRDQPPVRISGFSVDLDIRPGDCVEVIDEETGETHHGTVECEEHPFWVVTTLDGARFRCGFPYVRLRVQLNGTRVQKSSGPDSPPSPHP